MHEDSVKSKYRNLLLGEFAFITDGQHGYHEIDEDSPIALLTAKNAKGWFANRIDAEPIAQWVDDNNRRSSLQYNDIIVSTRGSVGYCAIVKDKIAPANIDQDVARVEILNNEVIPEYLLAYLNSTFGQDWFVRNSTGMVQQGVSLAKLRLCSIPILSLDFQAKISEVIKKAHARIEESKALYAEVENLLLDELGLRDWSPSSESISVKSFVESFAGTGRLDAEYYQPKYDELFALMKASGYQIADLKDLIEPIKNGIDNREFVEEGFPYIRVGDVKNGRINLDSAVKIIPNKKESKDVKLDIGDILFTRKGSFGNAAVVKGSDLSAVISSEIMLLRLNEENSNSILPEYLALFFNSEIGFLQSERNAHGVAFYSISQDELGRTQILVPSIEFQKDIKQNLNLSLEKQKQSKQLLEIAKRAVEVAIEDSEAAAMNWIDGQTKIGI